MRRKPEKPRVICIGWHKTGTSTLGAALLQLGYSVLGCRLDAYYPLAEGDYQGALELTDPFDAVQDVPWAALYRELDDRFPASKFILTVRNERSWMASAKRHFGASKIPLHAWLYGQACLEGNETIYLERYLRHNEEVRAYFADRPDDFLEMDLSRGDGWQELCSFLGDPVPSRTFPHENAAPQSLRGARRIRYALRQGSPDFLRRFWFSGRLLILRLLGRPDPRNRFNNFPMNRIEISKYSQQNIKRRSAERARKNENKYVCDRILLCAKAKSSPHGAWTIFSSCTWHTSNDFWGATFLFLRRRFSGKPFLGDLQRAGHRPQADTVAPRKFTDEGIC